MQHVIYCTVFLLSLTTNIDIALYITTDLLIKSLFSYTKTGSPVALASVATGATKIKQDLNIKEYNMML